MATLLAVSIWNAQIWHAAPLVLVISLVYGATRHEYLKEIVGHTLRVGFWLVLFLSIIFGLVWWVTSNV